MNAVIPEKIQSALSGICDKKDNSQNQANICQLYGGFFHVGFSLCQSVFSL